MSESEQSGLDLLGHALTEDEKKLMGAYETLKTLRDEASAPMAKANLAEVVAALWQVVNNLALTDDRPLG